MRRAQGSTAACPDAGCTVQTWIEVLNYGGYSVAADDLRCSSYYSDKSFILAACHTTVYNPRFRIMADALIDEGDVYTTISDTQFLVTNVEIPVAMTVQLAPPKINDDLIYKFLNAAGVPEEHLR